MSKNVAAWSSGQDSGELFKDIGFEPGLRTFRMLIAIIFCNVIGKLMFSDSDFREVRGLGLGRPKSSGNSIAIRVDELGIRARNENEARNPDLYSNRVDFKNKNNYISYVFFKTEIGFY
jgi:hypothetical protein